VILTERSEVEGESRRSRRSPPVRAPLRPRARRSSLPPFLMLIGQRGLNHGVARSVAEQAEIAVLERRLGRGS